MDLISLPRPLAVVSFVVAVAWVLLVIVAQLRFYGAYFDRYGGPQGRGRLWQFWKFPAGLLLGYAWFKPLDDQLVERRRRQFLLAWGVWAAFILAIPIAFILSAVFDR